VVEALSTVATATSSSVAIPSWFDTIETLVFHVNTMVVVVERATHTHTHV
jgi:hypothetical protein